MTTERPEPASPEFYLDQALAAFERARDLTDPEEHPATYGVVLHDIAQVYEATGRSGDAADLYRRSAAAKRRGAAPEDLQVTLSALATCLIDRGELVEAHEVVDEAVELLGRGMDLDRPRRSYRIFGVGLLYERLGDLGRAGAHRQALEAFEWSLSLLDERVEPGSCGVILRALARMQVELGRAQDAAASLDDAVRFLELDGDTSGQVSALIDLGRVYHQLAEESLVAPAVPAPREPTEEHAEPDAGTGSGATDVGAGTGTSPTDRPGWVAGAAGIVRAEPSDAPG